MSKKKTKLKLKKNVKVFLFFIVLLCVIGFFANSKYQEYLYTKTSDYALLQLGYSEDDLKTFSKLSDDTKWNIVNNIGKNEFLSYFVNGKYFKESNLESYLSLTVSKEEDFWHYKEASEYDYDALIAKVNTKTNTSYYTDTVATDMSKGYGILVNKYHYLDKSYIPDDLVKIEWKYRFGGKNDDIEIRQEVYDAFLEMWAAANEEGFYLLADSGFRTADYQETIYNNYSKKSGIDYADSIAARPGYSEHQTGLSLDIYSKQVSTSAEFAKSEVFAWLKENSYKYGFILRYPEGKSSLTGYNFESWHYRYLGKDLAKKVYDSGLTFDEYYAYYME